MDQVHRAFVGSAGPPLDSVIARADFDGAQGSDVSINTADGLTASEVESALRMWDILRANNLTQMSYEDFLRTYGVRPAQVEDPHRPELVRFVRDWSYPTNTVNPVDGAPSSAVSWSIAERADKDRFFSEPGFLFGVTVARPKVYLSKQKGSAAWLMRNAFTWLPALLQGDPAASLTAVPDGAGPLGDIADATGYVVDVRDILIHGDQFVNFDLSATGANGSALPLPTADLQKRYPAALADIEALFKSATAKYVRQDGVVLLTIAGSQRDTTPVLTKVPVA